MERYRKAVFVACYARTKEGVKYLILKRKSHWRGWEFTKGGINPGESKKSAVEREIFEETGKNPISVKKFPIFGSYRYKKILPDRKGLIGQTFSLYGAEIKYGKIKIDTKEHSGYLWLDFQKAKKRLTFQNQKKCLETVNEWVEKN